MVNTAEADVVSPTVSAEYPNGLLGKILAVNQNILAKSAICAGSLYCGYKGLCGVAVLSAVVNGVKISRGGFLNIVACLIGSGYFLNLAYKTVTDSLLT